MKAFARHVHCEGPRLEFAGLGPARLGQTSSSSGCICSCGHTSVQHRSTPVQAVLLEIWRGPLCPRTRIREKPGRAWPHLVTSLVKVARAWSRPGQVMPGICPLGRKETTHRRHECCPPTSFALLLLSPVGNTNAAGSGRAPAARTAMVGHTTMPYSAGQPGPTNRLVAHCAARLLAPDYDWAGPGGKHELSGRRGSGGSRPQPPS